MAISLLRKNNSDAITPFTDAIAWHAMLGDGIFDGAYNSCSCSCSNEVVTVESGLILYGGYLVEIGKNSSVEIDISNLNYVLNAPRCYVYLCLTIAEAVTDDDGNITDDSSASIVCYGTKRATESSGTDVIQTVGSDGAGTFYILLFTVANDGVTVTQNIDSLEAGVAKNAKNLLGDGYLVNSSGEKVALADIFTEDMLGVRYAVNADTCAEAQGFVGGQINKVDEDLYMTNRGVYLCTMASISLSAVSTSVTSSDGTSVASISSETVSTLSSAKAVTATLTTAGGTEEIVQGLASNIQGQGNGDDAMYCSVEDSDVISSLLGVCVDLSSKTVSYKSTSSSYYFESVPAMTLKVYCIGA